MRWLGLCGVVLVLSGCLRGVDREQHGLERTEASGNEASRRGEAMSAGTASPQERGGQERSVVQDSQDSPDFQGDSDWRWLERRYPEVGQYLREVPLDALLAWFPEGTSGPLFNRSCARRTFRREEGELLGRVGEEVHEADGERTVTYEELVVGSYVSRTGSNSETFAGGEFVAESSTSEMVQVGHLLSRVQDDAAWYSAVPLTLDVCCQLRQTVMEPCVSGGSRSWHRCARWGICAHAPNTMSIGHPAVSPEPDTRSEAVDCSMQPAISEPAEVRRANAILAAEDVLGVSDEGHPMFFRTLDACVRYRSQHPVEADELLPW